MHKIAIKIRLYLRYVYIIIYIQMPASFQNCFYKKPSAGEKKATTLYNTKLVKLNTFRIMHFKSDIKKKD